MYPFVAWSVRAQGRARRWLLRGRGWVRALGSGEAELPMAPEARLGCCQPHPGGWHNSRSRAGGVVFLSGQSVEGRNDCGHFGPIDWGTRVRIRCQVILHWMLLRYSRLAWRSGQGCFTAKPARAGPWTSRRCARCLRRPSGEAWIRLGLLFLPEAGLGRGEIVSLEWTEPWPELRPSGFCSLCWWWLPAEFRSLGGTPNYGPRQLCFHTSYPGINLN
jgi:hypothetical protein